MTIGCKSVVRKQSDDEYYYVFTYSFPSTVPTWTSLGPVFLPWGYCLIIEPWRFLSTVSSVIIPPAKSWKKQPWFWFDSCHRPLLICQTYDQIETPCLIAKLKPANGHLSRNTTPSASGYRSGRFEVIDLIPSRRRISHQDRICAWDKFHSEQNTSFDRRLRFHEIVGQGTGGGVDGPCRYEAPLCRGSSFHTNINCAPILGEEDLWWRVVEKNWRSSDIEMEQTLCSRDFNQTATEIWFVAAKYRNISQPPFERREESTTYFIPLTLPPLRTHTSPVRGETAREVGNSPPELTGSPTNLSSAGLRGLMEKVEIVLDPG